MATNSTHTKVVHTNVVATNSTRTKVGVVHTNSIRGSGHEVLAGTGVHTHTKVGVVHTNNSMATNSTRVPHESRSASRSGKRRLLPVVGVHIILS